MHRRCVAYQAPVTVNATHPSDRGSPGTARPNPAPSGAHCPQGGKYAESSSSALNAQRALGSGSIVAQRWLN